jgi:ABC-type uncharacterized transport system permease subunit
MQVEQLPPNKPNFLLILILFCVSILVVFLVAWLFLRTNSGHLGLRHTTKEPHSQLVLPSTPRLT